MKDVVSFIPGQEQPPLRERVPTRSDAKVWCELCGADLPDEFAADAFPMCGECIEHTLQAQVHEGTP